MYNHGVIYGTVSKSGTKSDNIRYLMKQSKPLIYNKNENKYLGRTPNDWGKFILLFLMLVGSLIAIFVGMFFMFTEGVINEDRPFRTGSHSALQNIPSLSFRPVIDFKTALIRYADSDPSTYMGYIQSMRTFIQTYEDADLISEDSYATCIDGKKTPDDINRPCRFNILQLDRCIKQYNFGYDRTKPCVFLKLNKVYGWVPDVTNSSVSKDVLVTCGGQNLEDIEYFPNILYYPNVTVNGNIYGYFSNLYYPYLVQYGYRQPIIALEINQPKKNMYTYNNKYQTINRADDKNANDFKTNFKNTKTMIYDSANKKFLGRSKIDWVKFLAFFFICLILMIIIFIGMFFLFTEGVINEDVPYRTGLNSILKNIPTHLGFSIGIFFNAFWKHKDRTLNQNFIFHENFQNFHLSFRPVIDFKTALIRYSDADPSTYMLYIQSMRALVQTYEDADLISEDSYATCIDGKKTPDDITKPCRFNILQLDRCIKQYNFGYDRTKPCVLIKMNRIFGWLPDIANSSFSKDILIKCAGQNAEDVENFNTVRYYPNVTINGVVYGYMSSLYYPYLVQYGYRQPLVGVEFDRPKKNVLLMITCHIVNLLTKSAPLTFEILID